VRGSLIFRFLAEVHRLDSRALAEEDPDGAGPLTGGYDPDFREPVLVDANDDGIAERLRREHPPVRVPCQVEPEAFAALRMTPNGNAPRSELALVFHFRDLERLGLIDAARGDALIRVGDRLGALYDVAGNLVQAIGTPPGLYVVEARPIGFGLHRTKPSRNLLLTTFSDRPEARI
jgi:hypothetical protein